MINTFRFLKWVQRLLGPDCVRVVTGSELDFEIRQGSGIEKGWKLKSFSMLAGLEYLYFPPWFGSFLHKNEIGFVSFNVQEPLLLIIRG